LNLSFKEFERFCIDLTSRINSLLKPFPSLQKFSTKEDGTPVTEEDQKIEKYYRAEIHKAFPEHAISGEEFDDFNTNSDYQWIVDPIDGTFSYISGVPLFGSLIGLMYKEEVKYGFLYMPYYSNSYLSGDGKNCLLNGKPVFPKTSFAWDDSLILTTDTERLYSSPRKSLWQYCLKRGSISRTWGDCFGYFLLCTGKADMMIDIELKDVDILPLYPILEAAGIQLEVENTKDGKINLVAMTKAMNSAITKS